MRARVALTAGQQHLVEANMALVKSIARKLHDQMPGADIDDLVGFGMQGLVEAAQRYDRSHGTVFTTFAYYRVRGAMFDGVRQMGWLPRAEYARMRFEERAHAYLETLSAQEAGARAQEAGAGAGAGEGTGRTVEDEVRDLSQALQGVATIFVALFGRMAEGLIDERPGAEEVLDRGQMAQRVKRVLSRLPDKERHLIELYYFEDQTLEQVGVQLGLSKSWTSRLHARAVALLREGLTKES